MKKVLVLAPHPDDETLGCGGTLLRLRREGAAVHWAVMTRMSRAGGFTASAMRRRQSEIAQAARHYRFSGVHLLGFPAKRLDVVPREKLVAALARLLSRLRPDTLFLPHGGDAHTDHRISFAAAMACAKSFRYQSLKKVLSYETLSETGFGPPRAADAFIPNSFSDITGYLAGKLAAFRIYSGEGGPHPFPRSEESIRALASLRGGMAAARHAEAFCILKDLW